MGERRRIPCGNVPISDEYMSYELGLLDNFILFELYFPLLRKNYDDRIV